MSSNELFKTLQKNRLQLEKLMQFLEMYLLPPIPRPNLPLLTPFLSNNSYVMGALHIQIYLEITMQFADEDHHLVSIMETLQPLQLADFGVPEAFWVDDSLLLDPVDHISSLDDFQNPIEKLFCIKETVNLVTKAVERHFEALAQAQSQPHEDGSPATPQKPPPAMSTDELLPLFIYVIIKSHPLHLYSNFFYIKTFQLSDLTKHSDIM